MAAIRQNIKKFTPELLKERLTGMGLKRFRASQVFEWIYRKGATSFDAMTNLSKGDRSLLEDNFFISALQLLKAEQSSDGTRKFLFRLEDGHTVESVLIPDENRATLCISSQVGCAQACRFCLTGTRGLRRNLEAFEIADQVLTVENYLEQGTSGEAGGHTGRLSEDRGRHVTNIVLMGMGEPLANFDNVMAALTIITAERGLQFSPRRVTLSTSGLVPEISRLGRAGIKVNLAVSLNAATDDTRSRIMPVNRRYPIRELLAACRRYPLEARRKITFEYVMLRDVNDSEEDALRLVRLLKGIRCKVNLIPFNPFPESQFKRPDDTAVRRFQKILLEHHYIAPVRESRGRDISAACGQLKEQAL